MGTITKVPPESRWSVFYLIAALAVLAALVAPPSAHAASGYLNTWNSLYGTQQNSGNGAGCQVCHAASTQNLNPYGKAFCDAGGNTTQRIQAAENPDSDGDPTGTNNIGEINANSQPGWTTTAVPTYQRGNCSARNINETAPANIGDLDPAGNVPPTADANGPYNGTAGQQVSFDGSGSTDSDGTITAYNWTFGDGATGTGVNPTHTYAAAGTYDVSLTVVDDAGDSSAPSTSTATIVAAQQDPIADPDGPYTRYRRSSGRL